jgi:hypothetical protein
MNLKAQIEPIASATTILGFSATTTRQAIAAMTDVISPIIRAPLIRLERNDSAISDAMIISIEFPKTYSSTVIA